MRFTDGNIWNGWLDHVILQETPILYTDNYQDDHLSIYSGIAEYLKQQAVLFVEFDVLIGSY